SLFTYSSETSKRQEIHETGTRLVDLVILRFLQIILLFLCSLLPPHLSFCCCGTAPLLFCLAICCIHLFSQQ
ncbi:hypothetical protein S245_016354, partial [Arachis hypogaea]